MDRNFIAFVTAKLEEISEKQSVQSKQIEGVQSDISGLKSLMIEQNQAVNITGMYFLSFCFYYFIFFILFPLYLLSLNRLCRQNITRTRKQKL